MEQQYDVRVRNLRDLLERWFSSPLIHAYQAKEKRVLHLLISKRITPAT